MDEKNRQQQQQKQHKKIWTFFHFNSKQKKSSLNKRQHRLRSKICSYTGSFTDIQSHSFSHFVCARFRCVLLQFGFVVFSLLSAPRIYLYARLPALHARASHFFLFFFHLFHWWWFFILFILCHEQWYSSKIAFMQIGLCIFVI